MPRAIGVLAIFTAQLLSAALCFQTFNSANLLRPWKGIERSQCFLDPIFAEYGNFNVR